MPTLLVAHYGHPMLKGAKHWSFLLPKGNSEFATAYQVTGSTYTYEIKDPEDVPLDPSKQQNFMGVVEVGVIDDDRRKQFESLVKEVPVTRGEKDWNCQNWIIQVLEVLNGKGFDVKPYTLRELQELLEKPSI